MAKVAVLLANDFEDSEFTVPYQALTEAGHQVVVVGSESGKTVRAKHSGAGVSIDRSAEQVSLGDFDAMVIPGGYSPDHLRLDEHSVKLVRESMEQGKLVAAVCHGPQLLIEAGVVAGRTMTSWPSVRRDLENAGAHWVDREVVEDGNLLTSRNPDDLNAFSQAILQRLPASQGAARTQGRA